MPVKKREGVAKVRWLTAQAQEKGSLENVEDIREWVRVRRQSWANLLDSLKNEIAFDNSTRVLDIGGGPTSIFLALKEGEKYVIDPLSECLFELNPFMKEVEEYKDVNFIASPIEEVTLDKQFDLIFAINAIDHFVELKATIDKIDELLAPSGTLVVIVDCYADPAVRNVIRFFDADLPHPHHLVIDDIFRLFPSYRLIRQDNEIWKIFNEPPFRGETGKMEIYRIDKFIARMLRHLREEKQGILFSLKFILCFSLALLTASLRRREKPIHPLKKLRLFVFQKQ